MLMNQWYAIEFASRIKDGEPFPVTVLGEDLVIWRTPSTGEIVVQSDLCVHRGAMLSGGEIVDDCLRCPYHGWQYDTSGTCVRIPAHPDNPIPKKARIDTYPAIERYGFIWAFLGDLPEAERPPAPELPIDDKPYASFGDYRAIEAEYHWDANYERVLENAVDIAHAPFVHRETFGNPEEPEVEDYTVDNDGRAATATVHLNPPPAAGMWGRLRGKDRPPVRVTTGVYFPNVTMLRPELPIGEFLLFTAAVPIDENRTVSKFIQLRSFFTGKWADKDAVKRTLKIFIEDGPQVVGQRPELLPFDLQAELHVKSDAIQLAYRRWRQEAYDRGDGIDTHQFFTHKNVKTVIPSPVRRENPELKNAWVMKEAPRRPGKVGLMDETSLEGRAEAEAEAG